MEPVRVAVVGVGRIGRLHAELLARRVPGTELAGLHDLVPGAAEPVADSLGVSASSRVDELLADRRTHAVAICSSTDSHAELMIAAARAGKAIFCEKPISLELPEVDRALAAVEAAGVPLQIGFNRRFDPAHRAVRDAVASGAIGEPHLVRITSRDPHPPPLEYVRVSGGIFLDMTIHDFDMARYVTGSEVVEVFARGARRIEPSYAETGDVDTALVTLTHADGCLTSIDNSRRAAYGYDQRVEVMGSMGMAASENPLAHTTVVRTAEGAAATTPSDFFLERYVTSYVREWEAFAAALRSGEPPPVGAADGRAPLVVGLAAWRSLREDRPVRVEEIDREGVGA